MARKVKSLRFGGVGKKNRFHREHRSKKGRQIRSKRQDSIKQKMMEEKIFNEEEEKAYNFVRNFNSITGCKNLQA